MPIDWVALVAVGGGMLLVLIPILGLTVRFALKPVVESVVRLKGLQAAPEELAAIKERLGAVEEQIGGVETELRRLSEAQEFQQQLLGPADSE